MGCSNYGDYYSAPNVYEDAMYKFCLIMPIEDYEPSYALSDLPELPNR